MRGGAARRASSETRRVVARDETRVVVGTGDQILERHGPRAHLGQARLDADDVVVARGRVVAERRVATASRTPASSISR